MWMVVAIFMLYLHVPSLYKDTEKCSNLNKKELKYMDFFFPKY